KGQLAEAIPLVERVVTLRSEDARARLILAQALAEAGRTDEARIHARRVALERPDWEQARQLLETLDKAPTASGPDRKGP
ncbi:MAG TPA: tetratricopeptide repeat protein, partial [Candidatus Hydrogenedentes bacterium]|nr:tetratricopeptide repeat protein [Candidatus Hydrogenedentota bacterium]